MKLQLEIIEGHNQPVDRIHQGTVYWKQKAYAHLSGAYPTEMFFPIGSSSDAKPVGFYEIAPSAFRVGKFGVLEINQFELYKHLIRVEPDKKPK